MYKTVIIVLVCLISDIRLDPIERLYHMHKSKREDNSILHQLISGKTLTRSKVSRDHNDVNREQESTEENPTTAQLRNSKDVFGVLSTLVKVPQEMLTSYTDVGRRKPEVLTNYHRDMLSVEDDLNQMIQVGRGQVEVETENLPKYLFNKALIVSKKLLAIAWNLYHNFGYNTVYVLGQGLIDIVLDRVTVVGLDLIQVIFPITKYLTELTGSTIFERISSIIILLFRRIISYK